MRQRNQLNVPHFKKVKGTFWRRDDGKLIEKEVFENNITNFKNSTSCKIDRLIIKLCNQIK